MGYDIEFVASELMLTLDELRGAYNIYFRDADKLVKASYEATDGANYLQLSKIMHSLKGSSNNLRIERVAKIASAMEQAAKNEQSTEINENLAEIERELKLIQEEIDEIYRTPLGSK